MSKVKELLSYEREEELHGEEWRLRLALLKESTAYRAFWDEYASEALQACKDYQTLSSRAERKEAILVLDSFYGHLQARFGLDVYHHTTFGIIDALDNLDPYGQNDNIVVRFYLPPPAITMVMSTGMPEEHRSVTRTSKLKPSERLLKVDLSRKRGELLREFTLFLDLVEAHRASGDVPEDWARNYAVWEPDTSRFRSEAWQALAVWRLRRQRKPYSEISRMLNINISAGKMAFRRAYELIEGKPYDPEAFKRENLPVRIAELKKSCIDCPGRHTCTELCPDVMAYVQQDQVSQRELTTDTTDPLIILYRRQNPT